MTRRPRKPPGKDEPPDVRGLRRKKITAWLSGEKYLLIKLGLFKTYKNFPDYPLTEREKAAIDKIAEKEKAFLLP